MDFRLWLESSSTYIKVIEAYDTQGTAGEPGGDYDRADIKDYEKHLGLSYDQLRQKYRVSWSQRGWESAQPLPPIEGIHYKWDIKISPEIDQLLIGNDALYDKLHDLSYYHDSINEATVYVFLDPEQLAHLPDNITIEHGRPRTSYLRDTKSLKWPGIDEMIRMISKEQEIQPPPGMYSQAWKYKPRSREFDPRFSVPRLPGEDAKDWLLRAAKQQERERKEKERRLGGGDWE
jgi:hypothetical protein